MLILKCHYIGCWLQFSDYKLYTHPSRGTPLTATESASDKLALRRGGVGSRRRQLARCLLWAGIGIPALSPGIPGLSIADHRPPPRPALQRHTSLSTASARLHSDVPFPWQDRPLRVLNAKSSTVAGIRALWRSVANRVAYI